MPRQARTTVVRAPHHIYQCGANGQAIFFSDKDYRYYLEILGEQARRYKTDILVWCLMRDYINIIAVPNQKASLSKTIGRTHFTYSLYINKRRGLNGQLWHNRFQSCALDDNHLHIVANYVECQPVYGGYVRKAGKYPWSSAHAHISGKDDFEILADKGWPGLRLQKQWPKILAKKLDEKTREKIRTYTQTGRPLGSPGFVVKLEKKFKRRLRPLPVGRPHIEG